MKRLLALLMAIVMPMLLLTGCVNANAGMPSRETHEALHEDVTELAQDMMQRMQDREQRSVNEVISPLSAFYAMTMATLGAREQSLEAAYELFGREPVDVAADMRGFDQYLANLSDNVQVSITNAAWVNGNFVLDPEVERALSDYFDASFHTSNFWGRPAINELNRWISEQTNGLISEYFRTTFTGQSTALQLLNITHLTADCIYDICPSFLWLRSLEELEHSIEKLDIDWPYILMSGNISSIVSPRRYAFFNYSGLIDIDESNIAGDIDAPLLASSIDMRQRIRIVETENGVEVAIVTNVSLSVIRTHPQIPMTTPPPQV